MTLGGHTVPCPTDGRELASSSLTESWGDVRLVLATDSAGRWVVWWDDTEDTACLLESLPHLHLVGQTQTASDSRALMYVLTNTRFTAQNRLITNTVEILRLRSASNQARKKQAKTLVVLSYDTWSYLRAWAFSCCDGEVKSCKSIVLLHIWLGADILHWANITLYSRVSLEFYLQIFSLYHGPNVVPALRHRTLTSFP